MASGPARCRLVQGVKRDGSGEVDLKVIASGAGFFLLLLVAAAPPSKPRRGLPASPQRNAQLHGLIDQRATVVILANTRRADLDDFVQRIGRRLVSAPRSP